MMLQEVRFFHLQKQPLTVALPKLLERVLERGLKAVVKVPDDVMLEELDRALWIYDPASFLAHGTSGTGHPDRQPIYLTLDDENPNGAATLVLIDGVSVPDPLPDTAEICLYMFDGNNTDIVERAREDWLNFKEKAETLSYWQQKEQGGWVQKA